MEDNLDKFARLMKILRHLASPSGCTSRQLADLTGADLRTIQRDLQFLSEKCFDIVQDRRHGPYRLNRDLDIHGQTLTLEEVLSLALGMSVLQEQLGELSTQSMQKLQHFIKGDKKLAVRDFPGSVAIEPSNDAQRWLPELMRAVSEHRQVQFRYFNKGQETLRVLDPYTLFFQAGRWYVQGLDQTRGELRRFRLKRMDELQLLATQFLVPDGYEPGSALFHRWDLCQCPPIPVRCQVSEFLAGWLAENPVHPSQHLEAQTLHLEVRDLQALAAWIMSLSGVEVLAPEELRQELKERAGQLAVLYA